MKLRFQLLAAMIGMSIITFAGLCLLYELVPSPSAAQNFLVPVSVADITGDGAAHALPVTDGARWIQIICPSTNGAAVRLGDSNVSASRGIAIAAGAGQLIPPVNAAPSFMLYNTGTFYYFAGNGDKITMLYVK